MTAVPLPAVMHALVVRAMTHGDLRFAANLHRRCLGHGLFPALGPAFMRAYLRTFVVGPFAVAMVAERHGTPVGFLVGTLDGAAHYRDVVRHHSPRLGLLGVIALVLRPPVAWRFARTRATRYAAGLLRLARLRNRASASAPREPFGATLTHVAVAPDVHGTGVGSALVDAFVARARDTGLAGVQLVTRSDGAGAGAFYAKLGWQPAGDFMDRDGLTWTRYRLDLA